MDLSARLRLGSSVVTIGSLAIVSILNVRLMVRPTVLVATTVMTCEVTVGDGPMIKSLVSMSIITVEEPLDDAVTVISLPDVVAK